MKTVTFMDCKGQRLYDDTSYTFNHSDQAAQNNRPNDSGMDITGNRPVFVSSNDCAKATDGPILVTTDTCSTPTVDNRIVRACSKVPRNETVSEGAGHDQHSVGVLKWGRRTRRPPGRRTLIA